MLSLVELERAARVLDRQLAGYRVQAVVQPDPQTVILTLYGRSADETSEEGAGRKRHLLISCDPKAARVALLAAPRKAPGGPLAIAQFLRAHAMRAHLGGARIVDGDRQLALRLRAREGDFELLLSILGPRSNLYVLDSESRVVASARPLADTRRELALGEPWRSPETRPPTAGEDRFADAHDDEYLSAIESAYEAVELSGAFDTLLRSVRQALRKEAKTLDRRLEKLERELGDARKAAEYERAGELLKGNLAQVQKGATEVVVRDFETGEDVAIPLDPKLGPSENLQRLFKRYQKAVRSLTKAGGQAEDARESREALRGREAELEAIAARGEDALPELEALAQQSDVARCLKKYAPVAPATRSRPGGAAEVKLGKRMVPARLVPRRYRTAGELEIWVGRSDAANDFLSTRLAQGKDLFFHLDGAPGSHVVLRTEGREDPPSEAVLDACELAIHFSKGKNATRADVHVVPIKNVKKPKGAKPGLVMVHGGKTVHLRRTPARLERLLAARIED